MPYVKRRRMNKKIPAISYFLLLFLSAEVYAFLPPQLITQNLSSLWTVIAVGVSAAVAPIIILFFSVKKFVRENKKIILLLLFINITLAVILGIIFYYRFYLPV